MFVIAKESATAPDDIGKPVESATETKTPKTRREKPTSSGKGLYGYAIKETPLSIIQAKWSTNPDAPKLTDRHIRFLEWLWCKGGEMRRVDEYTVEVQVDPRHQCGRDRYAASINVDPATVSRWARALKEHGLIATRKTRMRERNPTGIGRTVWIVRLPLNAVQSARELQTMTWVNAVHRRDNVREARERGQKPSDRKSIDEFKNLNAAANHMTPPVSERVKPKMHTVQESTPASSPMQGAIHVAPMQGAVHVAPMQGGQTEEQSSRTPNQHGGVNRHREGDEPQMTEMEHLAIRACQNIGVVHRVAVDTVRRFTAPIVLACVDVHKRVPTAGAGLFITRIRNVEPWTKFEFRSGRQTIRPTEDGHLTIDYADGSNPVKRKQRIEDYRALANGGSLRTEPTAY